MEWRPVIAHHATMSMWASGYSRIELEVAQERFDLRFPPDLLELLLDRRPLDGHDWTGDEAAICTMLAWPFEMLWYDVENGLWWPDWGERPTDRDSCREIVRDAVAKAPKLIPLYSHRFLPETPHEAGSPIFSMYGFDTIYYGANLDEYFENEFNARRHIGKIRHIPFWSDLVEEHEQVFYGTSPGWPD